MANSLRCTHCNSSFDPSEVDHQRQIATCSSCGRLVDVRAQLQAGAQAIPTAPQRLRQAVDLPRGMSFESEVLPTTTTSSSTRLTIRRRWLRGKHWVLLLICIGMSAVVTSFWLGHGPDLGEGRTVWLVFGTLFVLSWDYNLLTMFVNTTTIRAEAAGVHVGHGPLPSLFGRGQKLDRAQVNQLFAAKHGSLYAVRAQLTDGSTTSLVAPLVSPEQALFVEQQLEKVLGLVDFAVDGELTGQVAISGQPVAGAKSGAALALAVPAIVIGAVTLFFFAAKTEVSGRLESDGAAGSWVFTPDDCVSGQREGFGGVVLSSNEDRARVVRVVKDPVKGGLLVVAETSGKTHVFDPDACSSLDLLVERTNTSINDIWVVDGKASVRCEGLSGSVKFEGCH